MTSSSEWLGENEAINLMNLLSDLLGEWFGSLLNYTIRLVLLF